MCQWVDSITAMDWKRVNRRTMLLLPSVFMAYNMFMKTIDMFDQF